jgi:hypothetical protein
MRLQLAKQGNEVAGEQRTFGQDARHGQMLKSQAGHAQRAANIERLRVINRRMGDTSLDAELKAEAERDVQKAAAFERVRRI